MGRIKVASELELRYRHFGWATYFLSTIYCTKDCSSKLVVESACKLGTPS